MSLKVIPSQRGADLVYKFEGTIDEHAVMPTLPSPLPPKVILDLGGVISINSLGCRHWVNWVKTFSTEGRLELENCTPGIINQANILVGFLPKNAEISSFYVPYFCEPCAFEQLILLKRGADYSLGKPPELASQIPCPKCKEPMDLDVLKDRYLRFLVSRA